MKQLVTTACDLLAGGENLVLARITTRQGSAPRTAGARMLVTADGTLHGTIGGGLLEAVAIEQSVLALKTGVSRVLFFDLNYEDISNMDMICGGAVEVLLDVIQATDENRRFFSAWRQILDLRQQGLFVTTVQEADGCIQQVDRCLMMADGRIVGRFPLSREACDQVRQAGAVPRAVMTAMALDNATVLVEWIVKPKTVYLFGAGHVAQPTAAMAAMVGFQVAVLDDRDSFANEQRFPQADAIRVLTDFDHAMDELPIDRDSYIVILTRGHLHDKAVLAQALRTDAGYIGMIGSRRKRDAIYSALRSEGFGETDVQRVFSPIGLSIGAETPEEIAVSIVAELVQQRAASLDA